MGRSSLFEGGPLSDQGPASVQGTGALHPHSRSQLTLAAEEDEKTILIEFSLADPHFVIAVDIPRHGEPHFKEGARDIGDLSQRVHMSVTRQ